MTLNKLFLSAILHYQRMLGQKVFLSIYEQIHVKKKVACYNLCKKYYCVTKIRYKPGALKVMVDC